MRNYTGYFVYALVFMAFAGTFAVLALIAEGDADAAAAAAVDFANMMAWVGAAFVALPALFATAEAIHGYTSRLAWLFDEEPTGYDVVEPVQIASDDAYDYADGLEDGHTVIEDKRDAECYLAEPRGDADA